MADSVNFDRMADRYDETRGGMDRGRAYADVVAGHLAAGPILEIGVGTGLVANGLVDLGHDVTGIDLSTAMLRRALARLGSRVAVGDAERLPTRTASVANVVASWVLHLVGDRQRALDEAARVLRAGGRLVVIDARPEWEPDDILPIQSRVFGLARQFSVTEVAEAGAFRPVASPTGVPDRFEQSPADVADLIEQRSWSSLWDLDDDTWKTVVVPVIDDLRSLPEPERPRVREFRHPVSVFERA